MNDDAGASTQSTANGVKETNSGAIEVRYVLKKALNHAWKWFALHANQRMQAVNFFLVASAFLTAAYVAALRFPIVAIGVSTLGMLFSIVFFRFEIRIQELIKAGERALKPAQQKLAQLTGISELEICEFVETPTRPFTSYGRVIRLIYGSAAMAYLGGVFYGVSRLGTSDDSLQPFTYQIFVVVAGIIALYLGQEIANREPARQSWFQRVIGAAIVGAGVWILVACGIRLLR